MKNKIIFCIIIFILFSCTKNDTKEINKNEYIDHINDINIFDELDNSTKEQIKKANSGNNFDNYHFNSLYKNLYDKDLIDINGNTINLNNYDKFILEVVSVNCNHCKNQLKSLDSLINKSDIQFIQYFNVGNKEEIVNFYNDANIEINDQIIIIENDESFKDYLLDYVGIKMYPTLISYKNGMISFISDGETNDESYNYFLDISFENNLDESLIKEAIDKKIDIDDIRNSLSKDNLNKLNELDNDSYTTKLTFELMGKDLNFNNTINNISDIYYSEIDDYTIYEDKELVIFYLYINDRNDITKIEFINELINNEDISYFIILNEGLDSSSKTLKGMNVEMKCPIVSSLSYIPIDLINFGVINYPTSIFVDKGIITGVYSNINSIDKFNNAINIFLGENNIALKKNN